MAVSIHHVYLELIWLDSMDNPVLKNSTGTSHDALRRATKQEIRVRPNLSGSGSTPNSADWPTVRDYLALEAADDFAFAYMDQTQLITQMIT